MFTVVSLSATACNQAFGSALRDEGHGLREAVETGFAKAFWTILDANLTTAVAGLMLLNFGTGPIRGFAVTLIIGIICTVYTAYFVSKINFQFYMGKTRGKKISI